MTNAVENMFGLMPKAQNAGRTSSKHDPLINFKLDVGAEKRERWAKAMKRISKRYQGGANMILASMFDDILEKVEKFAATIPEKADKAEEVADAKKVAKKNGGAV